VPEACLITVRTPPADPTEPAASRCLRHFIASGTRDASHQVGRTDRHIRISQVWMVQAHTASVTALRSPSVLTVKVILTSLAQYAQLRRRNDGALDAEMPRLCAYIRIAVKSVVLCKQGHAPRIEPVGRFAFGRGVCPEMRRRLGCRRAPKCPAVFVVRQGGKLSISAPIEASNTCRTACV